MQKLPKPTDQALDVFQTCIDNIQNQALRTRLASIEGDIVTAAEEFDNAAKQAMLHTVPIQTTIRDVVSKDEMSDVYELKMAKKNAPGRPFYDKLMAVPIYGRCPLCGQRMVSTLDHHLPKAQYPALTVLPTNLVPACGDCNKSKGAIHPATANKQTIHPYYDDVECQSWLRAQIIESSPPALRFYVEIPLDWDPVTGERVKHHFNLLDLGKLYGSHAAEEILNIRNALSNLFARAGCDGVRQHLEVQAASCVARRLNSWQSAMYAALATSNWFCSGGFNSQ
jgi:5-methylcytosine-specific restriction endonuclease McrA